MAAVLGICRCSFDFFLYSIEIEAGLFAAAIDISRSDSQLRVLRLLSKTAKLAATHCRLVFKTFLSSPMGVFGLFILCVCMWVSVRMRNDFNIAIGFGREKVEHNDAHKQLEFHTFRFETGLARRPFWSLSRCRKVWHGMTHCERFALDGSGNLCIYRCHGLAVALLAQQLRRGREKGSYHLECFVFWDLTDCHMVRRYELTGYQFRLLVCLNVNLTWLGCLPARRRTRLACRHLRNRTLCGHVLVVDAPNTLTGTLVCVCGCLCVCYLNMLCIGVRRAKNVSWFITACGVDFVCDKYAFKLITFATWIIGVKSARDICLSRCIQQQQQHQQ